MTVGPTPAQAKSVTEVEGAREASGTPRRALIVSFYFPPYQTIGTIRVGKLAKFLIAQGWEIRVLSAQHTTAPDLPLEIPEELIVRTPWTNIDRMFSRRALFSLFRSSAAKPIPNPTADPTAPQPTEAPHDFDAGFSGRLRRRLHKLFFTLVHWPDRQIGWLPHAIQAGDRLLAEWCPDVILASSPPPTTLLAADLLARRHDLPWIADFRDPWVDTPYYEHPRWRLWVERAWEKSVVGRCSGIVSVSPVVRDQFAAKFNTPSVLAMNGFDPADYPDADRPDGAARPNSADDRLRLVFTGHIYSGYSDPTILFQALRDMGAEGKQVHVEFYGTCGDAVTPLAQALGVAASVTVHPPVSHRQALAIQMGADALLSLQWINPKEISRIAAKLFEYLGARRPILAIGCATGPAVDLLTSRNAGFVCDNAADVARRLRDWLAQKRDGGIPPLPANATVGLTRVEQFSHIERLMERVVHAHREASIERG
jgi:glycosyltransferase involved in cell wall biosynthesis